MKKKKLKKLFKSVLKLGFVTAFVMFVGAILAVGFAIFSRRRSRDHAFRGDYRRFERPRAWETRAYR